ncbi:hypothetical protein HMPREF0658_1037 [Hoylesella marshii DSM 16973 = JCM 13450]|uniref:Uncharacterized protein n=1 Tax=Hoylesella marshii DSM 16973 = JCM 13450 TaxID=862515 RepID=E0NS86_9BACT|nr:hypothetical protein HMPREF0658_1037 [Hoylesella marshii DSM 16973 = JCM 13450]
MLNMSKCQTKRKVKCPAGASIRTDSGALARGLYLELMFPY